VRPIPFVCLAAVKSILVDRAYRIFESRFIPFKWKLPTEIFVYGVEQPGYGWWWWVGMRNAKGGLTRFDLMTNWERKKFLCMVCVYAVKRWAREGFWFSWLK